MTPRKSGDEPAGAGTAASTAPAASPALPQGLRRVADVLAQAGHPHAPRMLDTACRTAAQAAAALQVQVGQIAKSIVFRRLADDAAVLVVAAGDRRVDEARVHERVGPIGRADAAFVKERTGFSIGGVAPVGHRAESVVLVDASLDRFAVVWAAAGHPHAVFELAPADLRRLVPHASVVDVTVDG